MKSVLVIQPLRPDALPRIGLGNHDSVVQKVFCGSKDVRFHPKKPPVILSRI
jgi:hypothetical protein